MDLDAFPYRATFQTVAKVISPSTQDRFVAKASLQQLKGMVPATVDVEGNPDLLFIAANSACAGLCNRNDDCMSAATTIAINNTARYKFIDVQHERDQIVGVVIEPGFSRFGTNEPLTAEEAAQMKEPFNTALVAALWKTAAPMLAKFITKTSGAVDEEVMSMSWEIAFDRYSIGVGSTNLFEARTIAPDESDFAAYAKMLRCNGGSGKDLAGNRVYRVIDGNALILGYGIVADPAANVKGIVALTPDTETEDDENAEEPAAAGTKIDSIEQAIIDIGAATKNANEAMQQLAAVLNRVASDKPQNSPATTEANIAPAAIVSTEDSAQLAAASVQNPQEKKITSQNSSVKPITESTMKIESLAQLAEKWPEIRQMESVAAVQDFVESIEKGSKEYVEKIRAAENLAEQFKLAQAESEKRAKELEAILASVQKELSEVRANAEAAAAQQKFSERMASFDEKFDLDDEDRKLIAEDVRAIPAEDDAAFDAYAKKCDRLMSGKKKGAKKPEPMMKHGEPDGDEMKAAFASIQPIEGQAAVPKIVNAALTADEDLSVKMKKAFGGALSVNGKTADKLAEDAAKAAQ